MCFTYAYKMAAVCGSPSRFKLVCMLCLDDINAPRALPCLHSFCENCLQDHINSTVRNMATHLISCPACGEKHAPPSSKLPKDKWASSFPEDVMIISLIEFTRETEDPDDRCDWCRSDGKHVRAEIWCKECNEKLCDKCQQFHQKHPAKAFKEHKFVPLDSNGALKYTDVRFDFNRNCKCNEGKPIETYCIDHQQMYCVVCSSTTHRQCNDVRKINEVAKEFAKRTMATKVLADAEQIVKNVEEFHGKREETAAKFQNDISKCVNDTNDTCRDLKQQIDRFQVHFNESAEEIRRNVMTKLKKNEIILRLFATNVDNSKQILKILEHHGSQRQQLESYGTIVSQLKTHYQRLRKDLEEESDVNVTQESTNCLQNIADTVSTGRINTTYTPSESARIFVENTNRILKTIESRLHINPYGGVQVAKTDPWSFKATFVKAVTQQHAGMRGAQCPGGAFIEDGRLILGDFKNKRLIEFDVNYDYVKSYKVNGQVVCIYSASDYIYMVLWRPDEGERYICKCKLNTNLKILHEMRGPRGVCGLAVCGDKLVISAPNQIQILSLSGEVLSSIKMTGLYSYVAVSRSGTIIHRHNDDVVMTSLQGNQNNSYNNPQLKKPTGIFVDSHDIILVCGIASRNLHQISIDGSKGRVILDKFYKIEEPMGVIYNSHQDEIVITSNNEVTVFEVYKLK